jgi:hypothetical protein
MALTPVGFWPFCLAWILFAGYWTCFAVSYSATTTASGNIVFSALCRSRVIPASQVTRISTSGGENGTFLVVENAGSSVRMRCNRRNVELARRIKRLNPAIELDV